MSSQPVSEPASSGPDPIETAWAAVEANWESAEAHKKFLVLCDSLDRLAEAGRRYRAVKEGSPERRAEAERRIDELLGMAMARVRLDKVEPTQGRSRIEWIALGLSLVLISAALFSMVRMMGR
ncbi:MAG: hypothetical protein OHK0013_20310 [Sandaracinaceae bacterium]